MVRHPPLLACAAALAVAVHARARAPSDEHWSLRPIQRPEPPAVAEADWPANEVDRFVLARLEAAGLAHAPEADRATLVRRAYLVVTGLLPAPEEVAAFVADERPDAWERLVDGLLDSPHYGERSARHWLDLARFAETDGFETNTPRPNAWPYRDWVIRALNEDLPYDRFLLAQVAGDVVGEDAATGFLVAGAHDNVLSPDPVLTANQRQDELAGMVNAVSAGFLGLTVACARCHDHKFDPISQRDYYALQAVVAGVHHGERPLRPRDDAQRAGRIEEQRARLAALRAELDALPSTSPSEPEPGQRATLLDDEAREGVALLRPPAGHGVHSPGSARGRAGDPGDLGRAPNLGRGRYSWWSDARDEDLIAFAPGVAGRHRIWLSWGAGWDTHATDARALLDRDGDLATTEDRTLLAEVDQRTFADGTPAGGARSEPLWSGLLDVGVHELTPRSRIVWRAGASGGPVTADALVVQPVDGTADWRLPTLRDGVDARRNEERFATVLTQRVRFRALATNDGSEPCLDELEVLGRLTPDGAVENVALGARVRTSGDYQGNPRHRPEHVNDGRTGNDRSWIASERGAGWVELELPRPAWVEAVVWGRDREGVFGDRLATEYAIDVAAEDGMWTTVRTGADRLPPAVRTDTAPAYRFRGLAPDARARAAALLAQAAACESKLAELGRLPSVYAGTFEEPRTTHLLRRGDPQQEREVVAPDVPAVLGTLALDTDAPEAERRLAFGRWLGDPRNPLPARVAVNRLWAHAFGAGLVATPSDFGAMGAAPSHPALLDWLAAELVAGGWSQKHVLRLILGSRAWRQASRPDEAARAADADARLLWRFPPRRLEAEVLRDALLQAAGTLELAPGGPGFSVFEPNDNYVRVYEPRAVLGPDTWRRAVYGTVVRMERDAVFGGFDAPDGGLPCPSRARSTTPTQALCLFNAPFVLEQADLFAERVAREVGGDPAVQVERAFSLVLGRAPEGDEREAALALVRDHGLRSLARALFNSNELAFLD